jgi:hypothetical protein
LRQQGLCLIAEKFSLAKTLTNIRNSSDATTHSSNAQLLSSLLKTLNVDSKINGFVKMDLQKVVVRG